MCARRELAGRPVLCGYPAGHTLYPCSWGDLAAAEATTVPAHSGRPGRRILLRALAAGVVAAATVMVDDRL